MRVSGSFSDVFASARDIMDAKVKFDFDSELWMIESGYDSNPKKGFVVDFDDFCSYWYDSLSDEGHMPSEDDINDYKNILSDEN